MYPYFIKYIYFRSNYRDYWDIFLKYHFGQCLLDKFKILNWRFLNCRLCNTCVAQYEKQNNVLVTCVDPQRPQKIDTLSGLLFHSSKTIHGCFLRDLLPFPPLINLDLTMAAGRSSSLEDLAGSGTKIARRTVTTSNHLVSISFIVLSLFPLFSGWSIHTGGWCSLITMKTSGDSTQRAIF